MSPSLKHGHQLAARRAEQVLPCPPVVRGQDRGEADEQDGHAGEGQSGTDEIGLRIVVLRVRRPQKDREEDHEEEADRRQGRLAGRDHQAADRDGGRHGDGQERELRHAVEDQELGHAHRRDGQRHRDSRREGEGRGFRRRRTQRHGDGDEREGERGRGPARSDEEQAGQDQNHESPQGIAGRGRARAEDRQGQRSIVASSGLEVGQRPRDRIVGLPCGVRSPVGFDRPPADGEDRADQGEGCPAGRRPTGATTDRLRRDGGDVGMKGGDRGEEPRRGAVPIGLRFTVGGRGREVPHLRPQRLQPPGHALPHVGSGQEIVDQGEGDDADHDGGAAVHAGQEHFLRRVDELDGDDGHRVAAELRPIGPIAVEQSGEEDGQGHPGREGQHEQVARLREQARDRHRAGGADHRPQETVEGFLVRLSPRLLGQDRHAGRRRGCALDLQPESGVERHHDRRPDPEGEQPRSNRQAREGKRRRGSRCDAHRRRVSGLVGDESSKVERDEELIASRLAGTRTRTRIMTPSCARLPGAQDSLAD